MLERRTAISGYDGPRRADGARPVTIALSRPATIAMVTAFPSGERAVRTALKAATGLAVPKPGRLAGGDRAASGTTLAALSPGRYLLMSDNSDLVASLQSAVATDKAAVTDLGHARTVFEVDGDSAEDVLMQGIMLDLSAQAFPVDAVAQTVLHHMDVTVLRRGEARFEVAVFRGLAVSLLEWLTDAAAATGFELKAGD